MFTWRLSVAAGVLLCICTLSVQAEFYPQRYYKERSKTSLNSDWKFVIGDGNYADSSFNASSWQSVNVPHSATYDAPTMAGERNALQGVCWYRRIFNVANAHAKHTGKMYLEFEGAMQTATVWLNGKKLGTHDNSGYTWFKFDITNMVSLTGPNVLAVRLDNNYNAAIPPGCSGTNGGIYPDFYLFSGLYRSVWLVCTDQCHIPLYGQRISIQKGASAARANVRIKTTIQNEYATSKKIKVRYTIACSEKDGNHGLVLDSLVQQVGANSVVTFSDSATTIKYPNLWSPNSPYLYRLFTQVFVNDSLVDDYVERFGVRWFDWTPDSGLSVNGIHTLIQGTSVHQFFGWVENALPTSRYFKEVELIKDMGANLIRAVCAPRDPAFYNACDELGMLSTVDVPTWGTTTSQYPDSFWIRENNVVKEMIEVGYNHPSILLWGLFNEPLNDYTDPTQIPLLNATAHAEDDTRMTYMANNRKNTSLVFQTDVVGLNYGNRIDPPYNNVKARIFATEYHEGWLDWCMRGSASDIETGAGSYAQTRWNIWQNFKDHRETNLMAGAVMWCHNDYNSQFLDQDKEMGCVDFYRIPKCVFYWFRTQWTGKASDSPISGLTPAKLQLDYDLDSLIADSTDFTVITASIRDASGKCVRTALPVTFNVSGPADYFGPLNLTTVAGKIALIVKAKNRTGALTISATTPSLPAATPVTVRLVPPDQYDSSAYSFITPVTWTPHVQEQSMVSIKQYGRQLRIGFPNRGNKQNSVSIINLQGRSVNCPVVYSGNRATVFAQQLAPGFYYLSIKAGSDSRNIVRRVFFGN